MCKSHLGPHHSSQAAAEPSSTQGGQPWPAPSGWLGCSGTSSEDLQVEILGRPIVQREGACAGWLPCPPAPELPLRLLQHSSSPQLPTVLLLPSKPLLWLLGETKQQCHTCRVRQTPRDRTEPRALSFHLCGGSCRLHPLRALRDPITPPPPPPPGGWLEEGLLLPWLPPPPHPVPSASHLLGWNAGQIDPGVGVAGASVTAPLPATPAASPFSEIHTIPPP